ncbi:hypothetical protein ACZ90_06160 [Streptomyces albus subsp. albus]|nr:hypothetical protein ACZ90_06160 [Streptomyces albus subsp. albus]
MADFRRLPEWEQPADRHTELIDPVITVRQLSRFEFTRKTPTRIDHALVFSTPKGSYESFLPPLRPTRAESAAKRYSAVYEVDMGVHPVQAELSLPSDNDAFSFRGIVDLSWQVADPALFVTSGHRDVPRLLLGELEQAARSVARRFPIAESATAEQAVLAAVAGQGPLGATAGLKVFWTVRLLRDQENIDHQQRLQAIDHGAAEQILTERRGMDIDRELDRRARQQDALNVGRALEYGRQQQELALQQQQWQHEQAMRHSRYQLELQRYEAQKVDFYQQHLQQGGVRAWALHLAQHPEDTALVMNSMREDQLRLIQAQMDLVSQLLGGNLAEDYELEGPKQLALRKVFDILNQRLPGVQHESAAPLPEQPPQVAPAVPAPPVQGAAAPAPPEPPAATPPDDPVDSARPSAPSVPPQAPAGTFAHWQPPSGYGSAPVMPRPQPPAPAQDAVPQEPVPQDSVPQGDYGAQGSGGHQSVGR